MSYYWITVDTEWKQDNNLACAYTYVNIFGAQRKSRLKFDNGFPNLFASKTPLFLFNSRKSVVELYAYHVSCLKKVMKAAQTFAYLD